MVRDGLVFKDENGQVIFNQYSFCELVKHLLVAIFSHDRPYYWAMFFYYGNGYWWEKGIPAQPEDMDAYEALEKKIMEKCHLKEPFEWK